MEYSDINSSMIRLFEKIKITPYSVLGEEKIKIQNKYITNINRKNDLLVKPNIAIVDPAGTDYILNGPCYLNKEGNIDIRAGGASEAIYNWMKVCDNDGTYQFPQNVKSAFNNQSYTPNKEWSPFSHTYSCQAVVV